VDGATKTAAKKSGKDKQDVNVAKR